MEADRLPDSTEHALVVKAVNGDAEAFGILYTRYVNAIYRYVYYRVHDQEEAQDLTDEIFVRAWEALPRYKAGQVPMKSWLYRIAHNLIIDYKRKRRPAEIDDDQLSLISSQLEHMEVSLQRKEMIGKLMKAMDVLTEDERQIVLLRFVEGLSHREVSQIMDISEGSSRVLQHRILGKLNETLTKGLENE